MENARNTADAIVVGGGSVGLHTAASLYEKMGKNTRILATTQESEWGGIAGRSLEQYRMFNDSYALAEIVGKGIDTYRRLDEELRERGVSEHAYENFPYIFTVGDKQRPEHIRDILPATTPERPDMSYYQKLRLDTESWGFNPGAEIVGSDELRQRYPLLDGNGIDSAMIVHNAGRLHFDVMKSWLMDRSRTDGDGTGVQYRARKVARRILLDKGGRAIGVDFGDEKIYSDTIVLAIGAFALKLPDILPGDESERIAGNFTITQRELFFAQTPGVQDTNFFLISPDMAIARLSTREGHASYGYAADDDPVIDSPTTDPRPNDSFVDDLQIDRKSLFVGRTYSLFAECSSRWDADAYDANRSNLAVEPFGHSAGYYSAYRDDLPVVGPIGDTGVILAAGSHHSGIMGGQGIAELVIDHALGQNNLSEITHQQTDINRVPVKHTGLVL
ncbi:MAG: dependent oxidoreductase [Patescibacteria group bacterium]|nr:dependent oxidoreductase [Patescibacteria group bacterium]